MEMRSHESAAPPRNAATRLLRGLIAKSAVEIAAVCAIAALAAFSNFSPLMRGAVDVADEREVAGWVLDPLAPDETIDVQLFIDGQFIAVGRAAERRDDLVAAGVAANPNHGFRFTIGPRALGAGEHAARVYAVRGAAGANKILAPITRTPSTFTVNRQ